MRVSVLSMNSISASLSKWVKTSALHPEGAESGAYAFFFVELDERRCREVPVGVTASLAALTSMLVHTR